MARTVPSFCAMNNRRLVSGANSMSVVCEVFGTWKGDSRKPETTTAASAAIAAPAKSDRKNSRDFIAERTVCGKPEEKFNPKRSDPKSNQFNWKLQVGASLDLGP